MNHNPFDQKNLNWFFGTSIVVLLVMVSYLVGLVHLMYRNDVAKENRASSILGSFYR